MINQRQVVKVDDIVILENALWETVDQKDNVSLIVRSHAQDVVTRKLDRIQEEASEIFTYAEDASTDAGMEATQKLKSLVADLNKLKKHNQSRDADIDSLLDKVKAMQQEILDSILEPMDFGTASEKSTVQMPFKNLTKYWNARELILGISFLKLKGVFILRTIKVKMKIILC